MKCFWTQSSACWKCIPKEASFHVAIPPLHHTQGLLLRPTYAKNFVLHVVHVNNDISSTNTNGNIGHCLTNEWLQYRLPKVSLYWKCMSVKNVPIQSGCWVGVAALESWDNLQRRQTSWQWYVGQIMSPEVQTMAIH